MRSILFLNRVYPPDEGATGELLAELAAELVRGGWQVTVVTGRSSAEQPRSGLVAGVRVERVRSLPFTRASHGRRALSYLSLYPALLWRALRLPRAEVVVTLTDPPLQLLLGAVLQGLRGSRHVHWAQDLYPELAEELGLLRKDGVVAAWLRQLSTWALRRGDGVVAIGRCMKARLIARGVPAEVITVIPNWGRGHAASGVVGDEANPFRHEHGLAGRFVVMYSGNFGLAHPFEAILDAAEQLQSELPRVLFLFVGHGPCLGWVREQAAQRRLNNVRFLPRQPRENLGASLAAADVHLASMREELCGLVVPSKVYGVLAAGRPCLFLGPEASEPAQLLRQSGCGSVLAPPTGAELAGCLARWVNDPDLLRETRPRLAAIAERVGFSSAGQAFARALGDVAAEKKLLRPIVELPIQ